MSFARPLLFGAAVDETLGTGPNLSFNELTRSGREAGGGSEESVSPPREGAALTLDVDVPVAGFFRLRDVGTNAVASFFRSRNCGSAEIVAATVLAAIPVGKASETDEGLGRSDGRGVNRLTRCAWYV